MYACLIWILPAARGLYYSCLDRELSLKALEQSQVLARDSGASQHAAERGIYNPKKGGGTERKTDRETRIPVPPHRFHSDGNFICIEIKCPKNNCIFF